MAAANCDEPPIPRVSLVLNVCESTMEIVLLSALTVRMVLVRKLYAKRRWIDAHLDALRMPVIRIECGDEIALTRRGVKTPCRRIKYNARGRRLYARRVSEVESLIGGDVPMSTTSSPPNGDDAPFKISEVTTANPRLFVPRSGSMATAMGFWFTATLEV